MKILLLSCCAPCCCAVIEKMARDGYDFAVAFYNPNIVPAAEYEKRREENRRLCEGRKIPFIELEYDNERWRNLIKGLENEPERGRRCDVCFYMRLKRVMEYARENGFDAVASVLGGMQDRRQLLIRELGLYAQDYCGCKPRVRETADKKTPEL